MIDLDIAALQASGVRYGLWSILAFSGIGFDEATDVVASLQWGERPEEGALYEPARAQMVFPLKPNGLTAGIAWVDFASRELFCMDVGLPGDTRSALANQTRWAEMMPAFEDHVRSRPTIADLFSGVPSGLDLTVARSDREAPVTGKAYTLERVNEESEFEMIDLAALRSTRS